MHNFMPNSGSGSDLLTNYNSCPATLPGVLGVIHPAMLQGATQDSQGDPARLVAGDVGLQLGQCPDIIEDVLDKVGVWPVLSVVRHSFGFFVSKERNSKEL